MEPADDDTRSRLPASPQIGLSRGQLRNRVVVERARPVADAALAFLLAPLCGVCREPIERPTRGAVCPSCWSSIEPFVPPCCSTCGETLPSWRTLSVTDGRCPRCRRTPPPIVLAAAIGPYRGTLERIVQAFKYDGRTSLARPLADRLRSSAAHVLAGADAVVPVPLHRSRERQRGFNQARELARHLGLPVVDALMRSRATPPQADLSAARRHANVRGAFAMRHDIDVRGLTLVVVDDVSTTGATLAACARPLLAAGAAEIRAATAAKTNR